MLKHPQLLNINHIPVKRVRSKAVATISLEAPKIISLSRSDCCQALKLLNLLRRQLRLQHLQLLLSSNFNAYGKPSAKAVELQRFSSNRASFAVHKLRLQTSQRYCCLDYFRFKNSNINNQLLLALINFGNVTLQHWASFLRFQGWLGRCLFLF